MTSNSQLALTNSWEFVAVLDLGLGFKVRIRMMTSPQQHQYSSTTNTCEVVTLQGPVVQMPVSLTLG
jgi:hypothetical protein